jgi:hypothetical protein
MAVAFTAPTCWPVQGWAVYRRSGGAWKLVMARRGVFIFPLVAVGSGLRETEPVFRPGDPRCIPSGGEHARVWHWDGERFVAGPWKQTKAGAAPPPPPPPPAAGGLPNVGYFKTPSGNIVCAYSKAPSRPLVECMIKTGLKPKPPYTAACKAAGLDWNANRVSIGASGRAHPTACAGDAGAFFGPRYEHAPALAYGRAWRRDGLRCNSELDGLTCRNKRGHGFFLSRARWRSF